jgi:hypothetical protein
MESGRFRKLKGEPYPGLQFSFKKNLPYGALVRKK